MTQKYPVGIQSFSGLREDGYAYVDKTEVIYRLISSGKYYFLSRPRRFGKSLLMSTIECMFQGRRDLFEGLYIDSTDFDWTPRPVFHLNFGQVKSESIQSLQNALDNHLMKWEAEYGITDTSYGFGYRLYNIIERAYKTSGHRVVVLIDEYDKMLVNNLDNQSLFDDIKNELKSVYGVLKTADDYIRFGMITGVSRFSKVSIFSDVNNLNDISLVDKYATICGITEDEIRHYFAPGVELFAQREGVDFESMMQLLKDNYDGYHFAADSPDIYNPFSLVNALDKLEMTHSWFESGTPSFLVRLIQESDEAVEDILSTEADSATLSTNESSSSNLIGVLFQTGYLTIKGYNRHDREYTLGIPNREVGQGLFNCLLPQFAGKTGNETSRVIRRIRDAVREGRVDAFMEQLRSFLADIPYDLSRNKPEAYFQSNLYIIFKLIGFSVTTEYRTSHGRIDILMTTPSFIYVIELKLDGSAEESLEQIACKDYSLPFVSDGRQLILIGVNFSTTTRNIENWKIQ